MAKFEKDGVTRLARLALFFNKDFSLLASFKFEL